MSQCTDISVETDNKGNQSLSPLASPLLPLCLFLLSLFFLFPPLSLSLSFPSMPAFPWALCTCYPPFFSLFPYVLLFSPSALPSFFCTTVIDLLLPHFTRGYLIFNFNLTFLNQVWTRLLMTCNDQCFVDNALFTPSPSPPLHTSRLTKNCFNWRIKPGLLNIFLNVNKCKLIDENPKTRLSISQCFSISSPCL